MVPRNDAELVGMTVVYTLFSAAALALVSVGALLAHLARGGNN